ncbi:UNVERIFIED_ORG: hypothetical protein BDU10_8594 [Burkholderia sp. CF145]
MTCRNLLMWPLQQMHNMAVERTCTATAQAAHLYIKRPLFKCLTDRYIESISDIQVSRLADAYLIDYLR